MNADLLDLLRCPQTGRRLRLESPVTVGDRVESGWLVVEGGGPRYPVRGFVPRFVPATNYADNFGMQWNAFRRTQLDSCSGHAISADRFWAATGWRPADLAGRWVLDAGCGAGRFAEVALGAGARVVALDYSSAVDACYANLGPHPNLHVVQGDIYALPLARRAFDFVYSLGVLQHTPDVARAFGALPPMVAPGGRLCVDFYRKSWALMLTPRYWLRPVTRRVPQARLLRAIERAVPALLATSRMAARTPLVGQGLRRFVPVADYTGILPLSEQQHREWALLDTFDWFAPAYDNPQTAATVARWLDAAGLDEAEVLKAGHLVGRGRVPDATRD